MTKPPLGTFFIRCRIKILHQPFLSYLLILLSFLALSPILGRNLKIALRKGCFRLFIIDKFYLFFFIHYNAMPYDKALGTFL